MDNFKNIESKLHGFIKKYYTNELIKGLILFFTIGFLYLLVTLFIEYVFWLKPSDRFILFITFLVVEFVLFFKLIILPILKLIGLQKGISFEEASKIIGSHFSEVDDKLLNVLQLKSSTVETELLAASIAQKSKQLNEVVFKNAIHFKDNIKYLKYLFIPFLIILILFISDLKNGISQSYVRVINPQVYFEQPAPFSFIVSNDLLEVVQGKYFLLKVTTTGTVVPENISIVFDDEVYLLKENSEGYFYEFSAISNPIKFHLKANDIRSRDYIINVIETPNILDFKMNLQYPRYINKKNEVLVGSGNASIPEGTNVVWSILAKNTDTVFFKTDKSIAKFTKNDDSFRYRKYCVSDFQYEVSTSNAKLSNYEILNFSIDVIKDRFPKIFVAHYKDSVNDLPDVYYGKISDDYGFTKLDFVYSESNKTDSKRIVIPITDSPLQSFNFVLPDSLRSNLGADYTFFFELYDNDQVNGPKKTLSKSFHLHIQSDSELERELLNKQQKSISDLDKTNAQLKENDKKLDELHKRFVSKENLNWSDKKDVKSIVDVQRKNQQLMNDKVQNLKNDLEKSKSTSESKEDILKRLSETEALLDQEAKLKELEELAEKFNKEDLSKKTEEFSKVNKQNEKSLDRILELTKRYYVEQKLSKIKSELDDLAKQQEALSKENSSALEQKKLIDKFSNLEKELGEIHKENSDLKSPMSISKVDDEISKTKENQNEALEKLSQGNKSDSSPSQNQKSASKAMKEMSKSLGDSLAGMRGDGTSMEEDIASLRIILENLLAFSFSQENLLEDFYDIDNSSPQYLPNVKVQNSLKEYFYHIDDSLYTLSLRQPKLSSDIFKHVYDIHYYLDESLEHLADNNLQVSLSDQQHVIRSSNELTLLLSSLLNSLQNASASMGSGGEGKGNSFGLPDIIQKQGENIDGMEKGNKPGNQKGKGDGSAKVPGGKSSGSGDGSSNSKDGSDTNSKELYEVYKKQALLKEQLQDVLSNSDNKNINAIINKTLTKMSLLENNLLEQGVNSSNLNLMKSIQQDLLKLDQAFNEQNEDASRRSSSSFAVFDKKPIDSLKLEKLWLNEVEILNRESLPLQRYYNEKVIEYFNNDSLQ